MSDTILLILSIPWYAGMIAATAPITSPAISIVSLGDELLEINDAAQCTQCRICIRKRLPSLYFDGAIAAPCYVRQAALCCRLKPQMIFHHVCTQPHPASTISYKTPLLISL